MNTHDTILALIAGFNPNTFTLGLEGGVGIPAPGDPTAADRALAAALGVVMDTLVEDGRYQHGVCEVTVTRAPRGGNDWHEDESVNVYELRETEAFQDEQPVDWVIALSAVEIADIGEDVVFVGPSWPSWRPYVVYSGRNGGTVSVLHVLEFGARSPCEVRKSSVGLSRWGRGAWGELRRMLEGNDPRGPDAVSGAEVRPAEPAPGPKMVALGCRPVGRSSDPGGGTGPVPNT